MESASGRHPSETKTADTASPTAPFGTAVTGGEPAPALLLAWAPGDVVAADRSLLSQDVSVGRSPEAAWPVGDQRLSRIHFRVRLSEGRAVLVDEGSTNGTYVAGGRVSEPRVLADQDVVRAGRCVFVFEADARPLGATPAAPESGPRIAGRFHAAPLRARVEEAFRIGRHVLIEGESGSGKELVARLLHGLLCTGRPAAPFVPYNGARFTSAEEAASTLFGIGRAAFSGVDARPGLVEQAEGGLLYLDEVHNLPAQVQRSLLRFAEDGVFARFGDKQQRGVAVRLVLGTNRRVDEAVSSGVLAYDLVARLHLLQVPPLDQRRADIPSLFEAVLAAELPRFGLTPERVRARLTADVMEALALASFRDRNVRLLQDLAATLGARLSARGPGDEQATMAALFAERLPDSPVVLRHRGTAPPPPAPPAPEQSRSRYEAHREQILRAYRESGGNLTEMERRLAAEGLAVHRKWLAHFLDRWGVRRRR